MLFRSCFLYCIFFNRTTIVKPTPVQCSFGSPFFFFPLSFGQHCNGNKKKIIKFSVRKIVASHRTGDNVPCLRRTKSTQRSSQREQSQTNEMTLCDRTHTMPVRTNFAPWHLKCNEFGGKGTKRMAHCYIFHRHFGIQMILADSGCIYY